MTPYSGTNAVASVAVVYLARFAEGHDPIGRFVRSYTRHPAGYPHDLVVIYKGFPQGDELRKAVAQFGGLPHAAIELSDAGFDINAYIEASGRLNHKYVLFLNSFTEFAAPGWLAAMAPVAMSERVGIVGAMGSYESLFDSFSLIQKSLCYFDYLKMPYDPVIYRHYKFVLSHHRESFDRNIPAPPQTESTLTERKGLSWAAQRYCNISLRLWWAALSCPGMPFASYRGFPRFPNPHIRSNGFMLERARIQSFSSPILEKLDACAFESGANSLTTRLRRKGLSAVIVGKNAVGYDVADWPQSATFRLGQQQNLLLHDNQTRAFVDMSDEERALHVRMSWGDYYADAKCNVPTFDLGFQRQSLAVQDMRQPNFSKINYSLPFWVFVTGHIRRALRLARLLSNPTQAASTFRRKFGLLKEPRDQSK